jgi:tetratricopeptide (TPR) repeat protein
LDWSWDLLTAMERLALAQCSVFEGGFTLAAAEAVLDLPELDADFGVLNTMQALVEKSLLRRSQTHRFDMLRSVFDYASERLAYEDRTTREATLLRHWRYFGSFGEQAAIANHCIEAENLVAACRRATAAADLDAAAAALLAAWAALNLTGPFSVAIEMAQALHELASARSMAVAMTARWVAGSARYLAGDVAAAQADLEDAAAWPAADAALRARALVALGQLERSLGHIRRAEDLLNAGLAAAHETRDPGLTCRAYNALGILRLAEGRLDEAHRLLGAGLEIARAANDLKQQAALLGNIGVVENRRGRDESTVRHYEEALRLSQDIGDRRFEGNMRSNLGLLHQESGNFDAALTQLQVALTIARDTGLTRLSANVCCNLGLVQESLGDRDGALERYRESIRAADRLRDPQLAAHFGIYLGRLLVRLGRTDEGRVCLEGLTEPLATCGDSSVLGLLACARAELAAALREPDLLQEWIERAARYLGTEYREQSELAQQIRNVSRLVNSR